MNTSDNQSPTESQFAGKLLVIVGASGSGKSTLVNMFKDRHPEFKESVSWTTRPPRPGEIDGDHYHFVDETAYLDAVEKGMFLEHAGVHGKFYGTPRESVIEAMVKGPGMILVLDVEGLRQLKAATHEGLPLPVVSIFISPPSIEELEQRLRKRGDTNNLELRLANAAREMEIGRAECQHKILNVSVDQAYAELEALLLAH